MQAACIYILGRFVNREFGFTGLLLYYILRLLRVACIQPYMEACMLNVLLCNMLLTMHVCMECIAVTQKLYIDTVVQYTYVLLACMYVCDAVLSLQMNRRRGSIARVHSTPAAAFACLSCAVLHVGQVCRSSVCDIGFHACMAHIKVYA